MFVCVICVKKTVAWIGTCFAHVTVTLDRWVEGDRVQCSQPPFAPATPVGRLILTDSANIVVTRWFRMYCKGFFCFFILFCLRPTNMYCSNVSTQFWLWYFLDKSASSSIRLWFFIFSHSSRFCCIPFFPGIAMRLEIWDRSADRH